MCEDSVGNIKHLGTNSAPIGRQFNGGSVDIEAECCAVLHDYSEYQLKKEPSHTQQLWDLLNDWPST